MKKPAIATLTMVFLLWSSINPASAEFLTPTVDVGTWHLLPDTQTTVPILVSSSLQDPAMVRALDLSIQIGDGGPINSNQQHQGTDTMPKITAVDIIGPGTLFYQPSGTQDTFHLPSLPSSGGTYLIWQAETQLPSQEARAANGTLAYVTIDTTGCPLGFSRPLSLNNVATYYLNDPLYPNGFTTSFVGTQTNTIVPIINNGQIIIVPEPATAVLLATGLLTVLLWRRRKRPCN
jgi:hypothetical protein